MNNKVEIYKSGDTSEIRVQFDDNTVWLNREQLSDLFGRDRTVISRHINNIFKEDELDKNVVCADFAHTTQHGAIAGKTQSKTVEYYNLDVIISIGYRVKSQQGVQFRQWATQRLRDYLVQGYAINEQRLAQKQQEVEYLKTGIRILGRAIEDRMDNDNENLLSIFANGLTLLDDYDHETLDCKGNTLKEVIYPQEDDYLQIIREMYSGFESDVFAKPKDDSFTSSIGQIAQTFDGVDMYPSMEEKAANLLYFIVKNHSFVDGNKRIAAACFVYFLNKNHELLSESGEQIISNEALAALTLFIATSKSDESATVKRLIVSILNRAKK
ncbi:death-on-curing family protein [Denitrovibrio acetiphilus DSM 12809]|uniref:Death-on-curing family protein n=1 Tax=Denitrovibrio acetiphilus (strain DSM 12809 / NBRC 114555 / N2460) TaxID=522772 RepID=D4H6A2_DENA2|nr:virulence protein RhuM/Fic/DOC family protein [Denitrovibrio acetiphilus]ADD69576.1 death-on-curing family protein [Denitrovibrio acetiphilus DSM 12809]